MQPVGDHTLYELQIISEKHNEGSVLKYFDRTVSYGGRDLLKSMIRKPKETVDGAMEVQRLLKNISNNIHLWRIDVSHAYVAAAENYYASNIAHTMSQDVIQHWFQTMLFAYRNPAEFNHIESGLSATFKVFYALNKMIERIRECEPLGELGEDLGFLKTFMNSFAVKTQLNKGDVAPSKRWVFYLDHHFRKQFKSEFRRVLDIYYKLDAYLSIAIVARKEALSFPEFVDIPACFEARDIWHPLIQNSVKNDFSSDGNPAICILTGANTSGKTTFLKSSGILIYLAHLGWPVPAREVRMSFYDRLFSSIHLSDDINLGYSHFYNEIMRVKEMAQALHNGKKCFVLIDELFRGTNQQDALHCSKTVLDGFGNFKTSSFIISTHLMELLDGYRESPLVRMNCFRTKIVGSDFENTFLLEPGIASEKVGKLIMEKAGIPELLNP